jgi:hypothetical protein
MLSHRLVVARFGENVDWARTFGNYTVYNKGRDDLPSDIRSNSVRLINVGREAHSYIYHIIENYDNLEDVIIFSQGNYRDHLKCEPKEFFDHAMQVSEFGFSVTMPRSGHIGTNARNFVLNEYQGVPLKTKFPYDLGEWWESTTGEAYVRSRGVFWNAIFSLRSDFIRRRSRQSYQNILDTLSWSANPLEAHFCERTWFNILNLPMNFSLGSESEIRKEDKDSSFDLNRLMERWSKFGEENKTGKISIRFGRDTAKKRPSFSLTRGEVLGLLDHVGDIALGSEEDLRRYSDAMKSNIERWVRDHCPSYPIEKDYIDKSDLAVKDGWYVGQMAHESMEVGTTGSTTGFSFRYMRWHPSFHKIEWDYHYNLVLDEFEVRENPNILYFFSDHFKSDGVEPIACFGNKSELPWNNHGTSRSPTTHYVNFPIYQKNQEEFFQYMFDYVRRHEIDVLFTSPPQISSMCNYIRKFGIKHRIGALLSSTGDRILPADAKFLFIDNKYFDNICDHMRCWDGGATFYTCKHRNYHLMDNLSWVEEIDGKMICTDYFNLASPFVRYWNGDYCRISTEYQRCDCGRLYREFEFMESRPFSLKGVCMSEIKSGLKELKIPGIKEVRCAQTHLDVVSVVPVSHEDRLKIAALSDKFPFRFITEEFHS